MQERVAEVLAAQEVAETALVDKQLSLHNIKAAGESLQKQVC